MVRTKCSKVLAVFLALLMAFGSLSTAVFAADADTSPDSTRTTMKEMSEILNTIDYEEYISRYTDLQYGKDTVVVDAVNDISEADSDSKVEKIFDVGGDGEYSLYTPDVGKVTWKVNVPKAGLYSIKLLCYPGNAKLGDGAEEMSTDVQRILYVNGKVPFSEARSVTVTKTWAPVYTAKDDGTIGFRTDISGNDLRPENISSVRWMDYTVKDATGYYAEPLCFYFNEGVNTISLEAKLEHLSIKTITLCPKEIPVSYEEYLGLHDDKVGTGEPVKLEAELPVYQSDESIFPLTDRTSAITSPQSPSAQKLNFIGGSDNMKTAGQWTEYEFSVPTDGYYTIAFRYKQNDLSGMFTSRIIYIDGEVPFAEAYNTRFDFNDNWQCKALSDGNTEFKFYLTAGEHTLRLEVGLGSMAEYIRQVESTLININDCYLEIMKLTGADPDEYRDYGFSRLMPNTIKTMLIESRNLTRVSEKMTELCGGKGSQTATLDKVAFLLNRMGSDEDEIASNLKNLKTQIGSLGTWLNTVRNQPLRIDYMLIQPTGTKLPRANASFFEAIGFELRAFAASFVIDYSTMGAVSAETLDKHVEAWTTAGRDQAKILKNLVSSDFTPNEQITADIKLVAGGTLLPSVLSGQGPDAFLGMGAADVINYAIRSAVLPLNDYEGFDEAIGEFNEATTVPVTLYGTTYGLPYRAAFYMMFVRTDILSSLGLEIPKTWDDVLSMLPVLQANNMSVGLNREYDIFLYQMGGDRFADDGLRCGLDSNIALEAFEVYTRFFTDYSFPFTFDGPNRFRTGEMPILIADYSGTYNQLTVFATEIDGLWQMVPLPGSVRADGTVNYDAVNGVSAAVLLYGTEDPDSAWRFIKWFCGHSAQAAYGSDLVTTIGKAAKYNTANRMALYEMPWTASEREALADQFNNLSAVANYPGSYIFARYLTFAVLAVVNKGKDPVTELQSYINTINKEITRKRLEFGLPTLPLGKTYETSPETKLEMQKWLQDHNATN